VPEVEELNDGELNDEELSVGLTELAELIGILEAVIVGVLVGLAVGVVDTIEVGVGSGD